MSPLAAPAQCLYRSIARHVKCGRDLPTGGPTDTALPRVPFRTRAGKRAAADVEKEVDKKYHFCWFTAEKTAPMVGLGVDEFLSKQDHILTQFNIVRERNRDFPDSFPSKIGELYSPRPRKPAETPGKRSRPAPRIDMQLMGGAVMQLRQKWPLLLEARSRYCGGRAVYVSGLEELYTYDPMSRGGTVIGLAEQLDAEVNDAASLYTFVERLVDGELFDAPPGWELG